MLPRARFPALFLFLLALAGCNGLGLQPAENFNDRVAYAIATHTAVLKSATRAVQFEEITADQAEDLAGIADRARSLIDTARVVHSAGNQDEAGRQLAMAITLLEELQNYLRGNAP